MRMVVAAAIAALALISPRAAGAQPVSDVSGPDTYLELHLGGFFPDFPSGSDLEAYDPGIDLGGTFGARFTDALAAELGVGYLRITGRTTGADLAIQDVPITAGLRARAPFKAAELSIFGGVALHFATASVNPDAGSYSSDGSTSFGAQAGVGVAFHLSPMMRVGAEGAWIYAQPRFRDTKVDLTGVRAAVTVGYHF